jgi:hypothetical protein
MFAQNGKKEHAELLSSLGFSAEAANFVAETFSESFSKESKKSSAVTSFEELDWKKSFETGKPPGKENPANYKTGEKDSKLPLAGDRLKQSNAEKLPGGKFAEGQKRPFEGRCDQAKLERQNRQPRTPAQKQADQNRSRQQTGRSGAGNRSAAAKKAAQTKAQCKGLR